MSTPTHGADVRLDLRVGKIVRVGPRRISLNVDVYNPTNSDTITALNTNYATWLRPTSVLQARFFKFTTQLDF